HSRSLLIWDMQVGLKRPFACCCYMGNPYEQGPNCTCQLQNCFSCGPGVEKAREDSRHLLPFAGFVFDLLSARSRELIEFRLAIVVRETPFGSNVSLLFQFEQRRIKCPVIDGQKISARLLDLTRNSVTV